MLHASSSARFLATHARPRRSNHAGLVTAIRKGSDARAAGLPSSANPYRGTDWFTAWREGWAQKDRELAR